MISVPIYGGDVDTWQPNKLVDDEQNVAYEPTDKEGKRIAAKVTMYLRLLMWRVKMTPTKYHAPNELLNCRCVIRPITPQK